MTRIGQSTSAVILFLLVIAAFLLYFVSGSPEAKSLLFIILGAGIFFISFTNTDLALIIVIVSMLFSPEFQAGAIPGRSVVIRAEDILLLIVFFGWISKMAVHQELGLLRMTPLNLPITVYIFICLFSSLLGVLSGVNSFRISFFHNVKYIQYFLLYFLVVNNLNNRDQVRKFILCFLVTCFIVCVWALTRIPAAERLSAPFEGAGGGEPNTFAGYLLLMLGLIMGLLMNISDLAKRMLLSILLGVALIAFTFTLSRGGWLGFFPMIIIFIVIGRGKKLSLTLILLVSVLALPSVFPERARQRVRSTFASETTVTLMGREIALSESAAARIKAWGVAMEKLKQKPLFGFGVPAGWVVDSQYTRVLGEVGLVGFSAFLWMLIVLFRSGLRAYRAARGEQFLEGITLGFLAGFLGLITQGFSAAVFIIIRIMEPFWFLAAIIVALPEIIQEKPTVQEE